MPRSDRLFDLIQMLRRARKPVTARQLADELEVTERTIYRDVATLQSMRVPVIGEAGVGYVMRNGYDLPPLSLKPEEVEAVTVGLALLQRTGDRGLMRAARSVSRKLSDVTPHSWPKPQSATAFRVSAHGAEPPEHVEIERLRAAMRNFTKLRITYRDAKSEATERTVLPLAIFYYVSVTLLGAWCELRRDFRHFRVDRIARATETGESFALQGEALRRALEQLGGPPPVVD